MNGLWGTAGASTGLYINSSLEDADTVDVLQWGVHLNTLSTLTGVGLVIGDLVLAGRVPECRVLLSVLRGRQQQHRHRKQ